MNLLFTRTQAQSKFFSLIPLRIGGTVTFKLKAELELSNEEMALARKYNLENATLITSSIYDDLAQSFRPAWLLGLTVILFALFARYSSSPVENILLKLIIAPSLGIGTVIIMTSIYFMALRKYVSVDQLTYGGRLFYCNSVVELDEQEQELRDLAVRFYHTLEKAKNWGGREINPMPDGETFYLPNADASRSARTMPQAPVATAPQSITPPASNPAPQTSREEIKAPIAPQPSPAPSIVQPASTNEPPPAPHPLAPKPPTDNA